MQKQADTKVTGTRDGFCNGIHELLDWQIIQYRYAVDEHRQDLSRLEGRCVAWQEAEKDFNTDDRAVMGEKWRVEYCGLICPLRTNCLTALHFLRSKDTEPLARAG
jgi:hypothetical protein